MAPTLHVHKLVLMQGPGMLIRCTVYMGMHFQRHVYVARAKPVTFKASYHGDFRLSCTCAGILGWGLPEDGQPGL